jgi:uncharacterized protein YjbI with pentapeptide repeats
MARKKVTTPATTPAAPPPLVLPFAGKTFWLDSQILRGNRASYIRKIEALGGQVVADVAAKLNYLVVASRRAGSVSPAEKKAAKVGGSITTVAEKDLPALLCPSRELALAILGSGPNSAKLWLEVQPNPHAGMRVDLAGADLRNLDLWGFYFTVPLEGVQFAGTRLDNATFMNVKNVDFRGARCAGDVAVAEAEECNFDGFAGKIGFRTSLTRCTFRKAQLAGSSGHHLSCTACDFTDADLSGVHFSGWKTTDFKAPGANFSRAQLKSMILEKANLRKANFEGADLGATNLAGADLTGADLRDANLAEADLSNATITGADFTGANLRGTKFDGIDTAKVKAKGLSAGVKAVVNAGPILTQLAALASKAQSFTLEFTLVSPTRGFCRLGVHEYGGKYARLWSEDSNGRSYESPSSWDAALLDLRVAWPDAAPQLDSVQVTIRPNKKTIQAQAIQALCEVFGLPIPDADAVATTRKDARASQRESLVAELRQEGAAEAWNERPYVERQSLAHFEGVDLSGAKLPGINLAGFSAKEANFSNADLHGANLYRGDWTRAKLQNANLEGADLRSANLSGADLTGANLKNLQVADTHYDQDTKFPAGYAVAEGWKYTGSGPPPAVLTASAPAKETLDFATFFGKLPTVADSGRIKNAISMLKGEKFSLFAETSDDKVIGVVRSQSSDDRVYACRLTSAGQFECGTQNLRPCGGLQGKVCKHLLVLILGLTKAGKLDNGSAFQWMQLSQRQGPTFDKEVMTATFLRYKGVETGQVDWRPTETVPEDYYAL